MLRTFVATVVLGCLTLLLAPATLADSGGPDALGVSWRDEAEGCGDYRPDPTPAALSFPGATATLGPYPLGFAMPFLGEGVDRFWVSPTGYISFSPQVDGPNTLLPDAAAPNHLFAAHWIDIGSADVSIDFHPDTVHVRWIHAVGPRPRTTDLYMHRNGGFRLAWLGFDTEDSVTIGYENEDGTAGTTLFRREGAALIGAFDGFPGPVSGRFACIEPGDLTPSMDCTSATEIFCGLVVPGTTLGGSTTGSLYPCADSVLDGAERIHHFTNPTEQALRIELTRSQPGQRLLLLDDCSDLACHRVTADVMTCSSLPQGEFFLVVDQPAGLEGPYELSINCSALGVSAADLRLVGVDTSGVIDDCSGPTIEGTVSVTLSNLGTSDITEPLDIVIFEDSGLPDLWDGEGLLGATSLVTGLLTGETRAVPVDVLGSLRFRGNRLHALVDPDGLVTGDEPLDNISHSGLSCEYAPPIGVFSPVEEWHWERTAGDFSNYREVDTAPLVGDVNGDGRPEVVVVTSERAFADGIIRLLDGATGEEIWQASAPAARVFSSSHVAIGDFHPSPGLEIVAHSNVDRSRLVALAADGSLLWAGTGLSDRLVDHPLTATAGGGGAPSLADLDGDGSIEIIYGANVLRGLDGTAFWIPQAGGTRGINQGTQVEPQDGALSIVVDLFGDGQPEVVAGPTAYEWDEASGMGLIRWQNGSVPDGYTAVGSFDDDLGPEIVVVAEGDVYLLDGQDGSLLWMRRLPRDPSRCPGPTTDLAGGAPTVADFDGDCAPEIGVVADGYYVVLETDGRVKWQRPIQDCSARTGSAVFDFEGDGSAEVVFADERRLRVLRGSDGEELFSTLAVSHTWTDTVTIADVDGDGAAELLFPQNPCSFLDPGCGLQGSLLAGVKSFGTANGDWVNTRGIWNQHSYHVDNVLEDGRIPSFPASESPSWLTHGTYRGQVGTDAHLAPNLVLSELSFTYSDGPDCDRILHLEAIVGNGGASAVGSEFSVTAYEGDPATGGVLLGTERFPNIQPGESVSVALDLTAPATDPFELWLVADDTGGLTGEVNECREDDNACSLLAEDMSPGSSDPPEPLGPGLRVRDHGDPNDPMVSATLDWSLDESLPRPAGDHYHLYRDILRQSPELLVFEQAALTVEDLTPRAVDLPLVHFYRVFAADLCETEEPSPAP